MKIVQTLWLGGKDLLQDNFGWYSSQHHLMAWALSCLTINEQYEDVELYTDTKGYDILITKLRLPYHKAYVLLDELNKYPKELWALPKVKTYSLQNEPFIHVDGDVFIWEKFKEELHHAALVVQNFEKPTDYYKNKFLEVKRYLKYIPDFVNLNLEAKPMCSCNAGIIGGTDLSFFKEYASSIFDFIEKNDLNGIPSHVLINLNIIFEQVLFYDLSQKEGKNVSCFFDKVFDDNGYKYDEIADFTTVPHVNKFLHLLGPHKRSKIACDLMSRVLLHHYPEYFFTIVSLFKESHRFFKHSVSKSKAIEKKEVKNFDLKYQKVQYPNFKNDNTISEPVEQDFPITRLLLHSYKLNYEAGTICSNTIEAIENENPVIKEAFKYESTLYETLEDFNKISDDYLLSRDICSITYFDFLFQPREIQLKVILIKDPVIKFIEPVYDWTSLRAIDSFPIANTEITINDSVIIACIPELFFSAYTEVLIEVLDSYILAILEKETTVGDLLKQLEECFSPEDIKANYENFYQLAMLKLKTLFYSKCIKIYSK